MGRKERRRRRQRALLEGQEESGSKGGIPEKARSRGLCCERLAGLEVWSWVTFSRASLERCRR